MNYLRVFTLHFSFSYDELSFKNSLSHFLHKFVFEKEYRPQEQKHQGIRENTKKSEKTPPDSEFQDGKRVILLHQSPKMRICINIKYQEYLFTFSILRSAWTFDSQNETYPEQVSTAALKYLGIRHLIHFNTIK